MKSPLEPVRSRAVSGFDRLAKPYRLLEYLTFANLLERTRAHHLGALARLACAGQALVLGDGDGRFSAALVRACPHLRLTAVDVSAAMLRELARRVRAAGPLHPPVLVQADVRSFTPDFAPNLIATHFLLDCLTQPECDALTRRLVPRLAPGGLWLVSEFRIPTGVLRLPATLLVRALYLGFRLLTGLRVTSVPDYARSLQAAGMQRAASHRLLCGVLTTELWQRAKRA